MLSRQWLVFTFSSIIALMLATAYVTVEVCTHLPFRGAARCPFGPPDRGVRARRGAGQLGAVRLND